MRIVAGTARGRALEGPKKPGLRPTADRVRESLFNILGQLLDGERVLDLYAGTGALSLEALSRGASRATLVDADRDAVALCERNARALGFAEQVELLCAPAERAAARMAREGRSFELIFADPPYAARDGARVLTWVERGRLLEEGGTLVVEHDKRELLPGSQGALARVDERAFGDTRLSLYRA